MRSASTCVSFRRLLLLGVGAARYDFWQSGRPVMDHAAATLLATADAALEDALRAASDHQDTHDQRIHQGAPALSKAADPEADPEAFLAASDEPPGSKAGQPALEEKSAGCHQEEEAAENSTLGPDPTCAATAPSRDPASTAP